MSGYKLPVLSPKIVHANMALYQTVRILIYTVCLGPVVQSLVNVSLKFQTLISQGRTQNTLIWGGGICRWYDVSGISREWGEYEKGVSPSHLGGAGDLPRENLESRTREAFLSLFLVKFSGFKLNFESQFDIFYAIFCFNFSL